MILYAVVKHNPPTVEDFAACDAPGGMSMWSTAVAAAEEGRRLREEDGIERWVVEVDVPDDDVRWVPDGEMPRRLSRNAEILAALAGDEAKERNVDTKEFVRAHNITADVAMVDDNPNMDDDSWKAAANHWRVTLRYGRRRLTTYFSTGSALGEPGAADVLDCLASDAEGFINARDFEDWASEYGYDSDSRRAMSTYETIVKQATKLRKFLGDDNYRVLTLETERL